MIYVFASVACSVLLAFLFKLFVRYRVDAFQAIVVNYFTCIASGWVHQGHFPIPIPDFARPWTVYALGVSLMFIGGFNLAALTVRYFSMTISQVMQKMSILIVAPFAVVFFSESVTGLKILGLLLAIAAILFVNWPTGQGSAGQGAQRSGWWLLIPLLTWICAGVIEVVFLTVQRSQMLPPGDVAFLCTIFGCAALLGVLIGVAGYATGRLTWSWHNIAGGIALGIPNYGSLLFILLALESGLEGSFVFPVMNVSIIVFTTIGAVWLFDEKVSLLNWLGVALAIGSIACLTL
jgi:drug/metabolite transporter (DMT)-like permease